MSDRSFKIKSPLMQGADIRAWQITVKDGFRAMKIDCPIKADGIYGAATRSFTSALVYANGLNPGKWMEDGVTPELRTLIRNVNDSLNAAQKKSKASKVRTEYRAKLRKRWGGTEPNDVAAPVAHIITDDWGYHPPVHDGVDVICGKDADIFAMVKSRVVDVRSGGWWGKAPSGDVAKGDGIIQLEVLENVGPFKKGMHIGYGHAEHATVSVGQIVKAGRKIGKAGLAVVPHIHLMVNSGNTLRGVGTQDPRPLLDYAVKHA